MTTLQLAPSDRTMPGLRMAAMTCLGLMILGLGATLVVMLPEAGAPLWPLVPIVTAVLGAAAAALFLTGRAKHSSPGQPASLPLGAEMPEASAMFAELHALLEQQRAELANFQQSSNTITHNAVVVGAQLASFVLDAQARLTTGVESAERVLTQPSVAMDRAADLAQRLEWTVPETLAAALAGAADAAAQSLGNAAAAATGQITALGEAAAILRRDAAALDQAGREIANTGAQAVMRVVEAVGGVTAAAATLPEAAATVTAAAKQAVDTMSLAASVLCADSAALDASAREAVQSAETLQTEATALRTTGVAIAQHVAEAGQALDASLAALPELQATMAAQTEHMAHETEALREAAQEAAAAAEHLAATASRSEAILADLPEMAGSLMTATLELREDVAALGTLSTGLVDSGNAVARRMETAANDVLETMPRAADAIQLGCKYLEDQIPHILQGASSIAAAGDDAARIITTEAGQAQKAMADMIEAAASAGAALRVDAERLGTTGRTLETGATEVVDHLRHMARTSLGDIVQASERVAATLDRADSSVTTIENAGRFVAGVGHEVTAQMAQLSAICTHTDIQAALLPGLVEQIASAIGNLQASAQASAQTMPSADRLAAEIERLPALTAHLEQLLQAHATPPASRELSSSITPLRHLRGVEQEAAALMAESEALAETVLSGRTADIPIGLTGRTAEILSAVDTTIHRLRSVATAVALASDAIASDALARPVAREK